MFGWISLWNLSVRLNHKCNVVFRYRPVEVICLSVESWPPLPQRLTLFENRVVEDVINWVRPDWRSFNPGWLVSLEKGENSRPISRESEQREVTGKRLPLRPADTLIFSFQPPELWDLKCVLGKPPSLWCCVLGHSVFFIFSKNHVLVWTICSIFRTICSYFIDFFFFNSLIFHSFYFFAV